MSMTNQAIEAAAREIAGHPECHYTEEQLEAILRRHFSATSEPSDALPMVLGRCCFIKPHEDGESYWIGDSPQQRTGCELLTHGAWLPLSGTPPSRWPTRAAAEAFLRECAAQQAVSEPQQAGERARIVCLCGSTRFYQEFQEANYRETMAGRIVLSVGFYPHAKVEAGHGDGVGHDSDEKIALDELHKRKIDLADEVLILDVGGYIGSSTRSELEYAQRHGKRVRFLSQESAASPSSPAPAAPQAETDAH